MESVLENTTTMSKIILDNIYGGWILKDRIIPVPDYQHAEKAYEILRQILNISEDHTKKLQKLPTRLLFTRRYSIYRIMYRLGFIRLETNVIGGEIKISAEYSKYYKPNDYQLRHINASDEVNTIEIYYEIHENRNAVAV